MPPPAAKTPPGAAASPASPLPSTAVRLFLPATLLLIGLPSSWCRSPDGREGFVPDLGPYELDITTSSRAAASAFNRGLNHCFNFNQPMALEAFAECASLDPGCAMCHWGTAYAFGPFLNQPRKPVAHLLGGREAASRAHDLATAPGSKLTSKERGLVEAMFLRYPETPTGDIPVQEYTAFEDALERLLQDLGGSDPDVEVLLAEAKMDLQCDENGYHFFDKRTGRWTKRSNEAAALLRHVMSFSPKGHPHPMAAHLYIHLTEEGQPQTDPARGGAAKGLEAAESLLMSYAPSQANHLQHMPAHTLMRTGRYGEAVAASKAATASDASYLSAGAVPYGPGHNLAVGIIAASMAGMSAAASEFGTRIRCTFADAPDRPDGPGGSEAWSLPLTASLRLGLWAHVLEEAEGSGAPPYPRDWPYAEVLRRYARGSALLASGCSGTADAEMAALEGEAARIPAASPLKGLSSVARLMLGASEDLHARGKPRGALLKVQEAAAIQASWGYQEPPSWHQPIRDCVGQVLLDLGRFKEAEEEFRSSLLEYPESPFALWGLRAALEAQDDVNGTADAESDGLSKRIATAWKSADVKLTSACPALTAPPKFNAARLAKLTCPAGLVSSGPALRDPEIRVHHGLKAGQTANQVAGSKRVF